MDKKVGVDVLVAALGGYWVYFAVTARSQEWTDAFADTKSVVGVASAKCVSLKRFAVARAAVAAIVVVAVVILTWTWHANASSAFDEIPLSSYGKLQDVPVHVAALQKYVCQVDVQYVCNDAPTKLSLEHLFPLNEGKTEDGYSTSGESFNNATKDILLVASDPLTSRGFRFFCKDVPRQVEVFGPAVALANQYKRACAVCALTPTVTTAPLPPWLCLEGTACDDFKLPILTTQHCIRSSLPAVDSKDFSLYAIAAPHIRIFQAITRWCLPLAVTSTVGLLVLVVSLYLAREDQIASDTYLATV